MSLENVVARVTEQLDQILPPGMRSLRGDIEVNLKAVLRDVLSKMDLVSREEFDVQSALLSKTRIKVEGLETRLKELENRVKQLES